MGPGPSGPGNWPEKARALAVVDASMGPGPSGPGNRPLPLLEGTQSLASMGPGPSGPGNGSTELPVCGDKLRFNGAGTERSRKLANIQVGSQLVVALQWGRDRAVPEIAFLSNGVAEGLAASMGPGPSGPGNSSGLDGS